MSLYCLLAGLERDREGNSVFSWALDLETHKHFGIISLSEVYAPAEIRWSPQRSLVSTLASTEVSGVYAVLYQGFMLDFSTKLDSSWGQH